MIIGHSRNHKILIVSFTERKHNRIRIISARKATKQEVNKYERENSYRS
ncbi:MAG: BrnT family toxin [SAR324 cluster bacterium]|nr:BrnT family toxin [SAR324 cluster bacterium]